MRSATHGFTLLELMTAITLLGILMAFAVPSFRTYTVNSRISAAANDLVTALNLGRSEALRRSGPVVICSSSNQADCSGSDDWTAGWIVFADTNGNGAVDADELLQVYPALTGSLDVPANQDRVTYNAMGMATATTALAVASQGCLVERQVDVVVSLSGAISSNRSTCVAGP